MSINYLEKYLSEINIPKSILKNNPSIDPVLQNELFNNVKNSDIREWVINKNKNFTEYLSNKEIKDLPIYERPFYWQLVSIVEKLDTIFEDLKIKGKNIYLKIDTQGYEKMVLDGAVESLKNITGIQIEMALIPSYEGSLTFEEMSANLKNLGFKLTTIESGHYNKKTGKLLEVDGVFFKN